MNWARQLLSEPNGKASNSRLCQLMFFACVLAVWVLRNCRGEDYAIDAEMLGAMLIIMGINAYRMPRERASKSTVTAEQKQ